MKVTVCGVVEKDIVKQLNTLSKQKRWTKSQTVAYLLEEALRKYQPKKTKKPKKKKSEEEEESWVM